MKSYCIVILPRLCFYQWKYHFKHLKKKKGDLFSLAVVTHHSNSKSSMPSVRFMI